MLYISDKVNWLLKYCSEYIDHSSQYDERQEENDKFYIDLGVEDYIKSRISGKQLILLTGDAGDGKSRILSNLKKILDETWIPINDFSEYTSTQKEDLLEDLLNSISNKSKKYIIAANSGIFVNSIIQQHKYKLLDIMKKEDECLILNFNSRNLALKEPNQSIESTVFYKIITEYLDCNNLERCNNCSIYERCPFIYNIRNIIEPSVIESIRILFDTLYLIGLHITFRDLLSAISYFITSAKTCEDIISEDEKNYSYYFNNIFSYTSNDNKLLSELSKLDVANKDIPEFDYKVFNNDIKYNKIEIPIEGNDPLDKVRQLKRYLFFKSPEKLLDNYTSLYDYLTVKHVKEFRKLIDDLKKNNYIDSMNSEENLIVSNFELGLNKISNPEQSNAQLVLFDSPPVITKDVRLEYSSKEKLQMILCTPDFYNNPNNEIEKNNLEDINYFYCFIYSEQDYDIVFAECPTIKIDYKLFNQILLAQDNIFSVKTASISDNANIINFTKSIFDKLKTDNEISIRWIGNIKGDVDNFNIAFIKQPKFMGNKSSTKKISISSIK